MTTPLQAGVSDKVSHEMAEKILIEMGEFFQIQVTLFKWLSVLYS